MGLARSIPSPLTSPVSGCSKAFECKRKSIILLSRDCQGVGTSEPTARMVAESVPSEVLWNNRCAGENAHSTSGDNGPATGASLSGYMAGVAVDAAGNIYIDDTNNNRIDTNNNR